MQIAFWLIGKGGAEYCVSGGEGIGRENGKSGVANAQLMRFHPLWLSSGTQLLHKLKGTCIPGPYQLGVMLDLDAETLKFETSWIQCRLFCILFLSLTSDKGRIL
jgi:hypothetical protein